MACYHPLPAHRDRDGGSVRIGRGPGIDQGDFLELPCGRCIGCKLDRSRDWSVRIMHESMLWDCNRFVTLSYAPEELESPSLVYRDFQLFMKRLRKRLDTRVRFFCAGEYGERYQRPHFHACLFNCQFPDESRAGDGVRHSEVAEALWGKGFVHIGDVTPSSAAYVAGYTLGKVHGFGSASGYELVDDSTGEVVDRRPPFVTMSRRPGIGSEWYERYGADLWPHDFAVTHDGKRTRVPRFYLQRLEDVGDPLDVEALRFRRLERASALPRSESSEARRAVREESAYRRVEFWQSRQH